MPETAPLDVSEATVGYELDSITLRDIASVRYVRHHEWLDHVLGSPLPTSAIIPPQVIKALNEEEINARTQQLEREIVELEAEAAEGWKFHLDEERAKALSNAIHSLRDNFGTDSIKDTQSDIEKLLGVKMVDATDMRPVKITYDRQAIERQQAEQVQEHKEETTHKMDETS